MYVYINNNKQIKYIFTQRESERGGQRGTEKFLWKNWLVIVGAGKSEMWKAGWQVEAQRRADIAVLGLKEIWRKYLFLFWEAQAYP